VKNALAFSRIFFNNRNAILIISIIAAMAENRVIGRGGAIPWDIPADRRRFRELTTGHPIIMGRKTFESIGRQLPGRMNIILTRQQEFQANGCCVAQTLEDALLACTGVDEVFICGGEELYRLALPLAERIYLTVVHGECGGDAFFPPIPADFAETERLEPADEGRCTFIQYQRRID
jgi:dihydrofolate reductase